MRITRIALPKDRAFGDGLGAIQMDRLGQVVVIAGRNGSGKSRLLQRLRMLAENFNHGRREGIEVSESEKFLYLHGFVPGLALTDPEHSNKSQLTQAAHDVSLGGTTGMSSALLKIQHAQDLWFEATHPEVTPSAGREKAISDYTNLKEAIQKLLGTDLKRSMEGRAEIFGFHLGGSNLSEGQRILIQLCVAIHSQAHKLSEMTLIMDEPENHVYPSALLDVIETLQKQLTNGQIWIATHSVPLLAHFPSEAIWWMEDGTISHAGTNTEKVLSGLIGDGDRLAKLSDFLNLPANLASVRFAHQCLGVPGTVRAKVGDPQMTQIREAILSRERTGKIRILDFGAGKGRLAAEFLNDSSTTLVLDEWLDYVAFDPSDTDSATCKDEILRIYRDTEGRYFNDWTALRSRFDTKSFDYIVMCNVLHEIDPIQWLQLFGSQMEIQKLLKENGSLLIVEDTKMPVGEKAHQNGFVVLDKLQIKTLFRSKRTIPHLILMRTEMAG